MEGVVDFVAGWVSGAVSIILTQVSEIARMDVGVDKKTCVASSASGYWNFQLQYSHNAFDSGLYPSGYEYPPCDTRRALL